MLYELRTFVFHFAVGIAGIDPGLRAGSSCTVHGQARSVIGRDRVGRPHIRPVQDAGKGRSRELLGDVVRAMQKGNAKAQCLLSTSSQQGLEMIGISADRPKDFEKMRKMSSSVAYPTAIANQISDDGFGPPEGFPLTYVIDVDGVVRDKFIDVRINC